MSDVKSRLLYVKYLDFYFVNRAYTPTWGLDKWLYDNPPLTFKEEIINYMAKRKPKYNPLKEYIITFKFKVWGHEAEEFITKLKNTKNAYEPWWIEEKLEWKEEFKWFLIVKRQNIKEIEWVIKNT